jgi:hypothetical protein
MNSKTLDRYITNNILRPQPKKFDVIGAPFKIGDIVLILNNPNKDETFNYDFSGKRGIVVFFEYDCGCGQTFPDDPMIGVRISDKIIAEFWKDELLLFEK